MVEYEHESGMITISQFHSVIYNAEYLSTRVSKFIYFPYLRNTLFTSDIECQKVIIM